MVPAVEHATINNQQTILHPGQSLIITCEEHYTLFGQGDTSIEIYCQAEGYFSAELRGPSIEIPYCTPTNVTRM